MNTSISSNIWKHVICSNCGHELRQVENGAACTQCGTAFPCTPSGALDLRLQHPRKYQLEHELGTALMPEDGFRFEPLRMNPVAAVDYAALPIPRHLTREILSYFPRAAYEDSLMLDLGCGAGIHKDVCERAGYEWVGLDYESASAPILGDAQALPFKDSTFEFVLSTTVLQYIRYPFVAMREAYRVLKPHGRIVGTVAFLEPSHGTSYYHHTHLGTYNALQQAGFRVDKVAPSEQWTVFKALANMGLFHGMPKRISEAIVWPIELLQRMWWWAGSRVTGRQLGEMRIRNFTGSFTFIATKEAA